MAEELDPKQLAEDIAESKKAKYMEPGIIRQVLTREMRNEKNRKLLVKAVKSKLYQVSGMFRNDNTDYGAMGERFADITPETPEEEVKALCSEILYTHASTRERLPMLDEFYKAIFAEIPRPKTVADLACGLNPLTIPWQGLEGDFRYDAYDLFTDMSVLTDAFFKARGIAGTTGQANLLYGLPGGPWDLVYLFKVIPCLEQIDKYGGRHILEQLAFAAKHCVVTFPGASLSGKEKGMPRNYEVHFMNIVDPDAWEIQKIRYPSELVFILHSKYAEDAEKEGDEALPVIE